MAASSRAVIARSVAAIGTDEDEQAHQRIDELLTARERVTVRDEILV